MIGDRQGHINVNGSPCGLQDLLAASVRETTGMSFRLFWPIPPFWRPSVAALKNSMFIQPIGDREAWVSGYPRRLWFARIHGRLSRRRLGTAAMVKQRQHSPSGTFAWAIELYRESADWSTLAVATRKQRENIMRGLVEAAGDQPLAAITRAKIMQGIDARAKTPFAARHFVETLRGLFTWAMAREFVAVDPTQGVKVAKPKTEGFAPGPPRKSKPIGANGRAEPVNGFGSTCCSLLG